MATRVVVSWVINRANHLNSLFFIPSQIIDQYCLLPLGFSWWALLGLHHLITMGCTALNMSMANIELLSIEAVGWSMVWIRWKMTHWQRWGQHQVVLGSCFISSSALSFCEAPGELLLSLDYEFLCILSWVLSASGKFRLGVHKVGRLCYNGVWLLVGASWYYCGRNREGGRALGWQKAGMQAAQFALWKSNCSFKAWNCWGFFFLSFFGDKDSCWWVLSSRCSWLDPLQVLDGCSICVLQALALNSFEMVTAQSLVFLHWCDR